MARMLLLRSTLALGAVVAMQGLTSADDTVLTRGSSPSKAGFGGGTTMNLAGKGTAEKAAADDDVELTRGYHGGYHGGYHHGFYGGYGGYRGYRGYYGGYRGYYGGYRGYYGGYYRPYYYRPYYGFGFGYGGYYPYYSYGGYGYGGLYINAGYGGFGGYYGGFCGISGKQADAATPVVSLNMAARTTTPPVQVLGPSTSPAKPVSPANGTFRYDGGPASPVPVPVEEPSAQPAPAPVVPAADSLPVSLKLKPANAPAKPYVFKAYGEK